MTLEDRVLDILARPEWKADPPGSGVIAEVLHERRRDVMAALKVLAAHGKITDTGGNPHVARAGWALAAQQATGVPTTPLQGLDALRNPIRGTAQITPDGMITIGIHADGTPARLLLRDPGHDARHTAVIGDAASGKSVLLRCILDAASAAGLDVQVVDAFGGALAPAGHATAGSIAAVRAVLAEQYDLARAQLADPDPHRRPTRLLVIDDLTELTHDHGVAEQLRQLAPIAGRAGIVIVTASQSVTIATYAGDLTRALLTRRSPVLLRTTSPLTGTGIGAGNLPPLPAGLPGIGYLPRYSTEAFRTWLPCSD